MSTNIKIYINCDTQDLPFGTSGVDWVELNLTYDKLIYSAGSDTVKDGEVIPSPTQLSQAGVLITTSDVIVPHYFLADASVNLLKEIHNAGNQNKRYVFCFSFDGVTASEPVLELWDDITLSTITNYSLGSGIAMDSWFRGITTTDALPRTNWVGSKLAGSSNSHFLFLNNGNGALSAAKDLYVNLKVIVPANFANAGAENPVMAIKYTTN